MYEPLRRRALALLKVPPEPQPPFGSPSSLRVFRAGRNYFRLRLTGWAITQLLALAGIIFWTAMLIRVETIARADEANQRVPATSPAVVSPVAPPVARSKASNRVEVWSAHFAERVKAAAEAGGPAAKAGNRAGRTSGWAGFKQALVEIGLILPTWTFPLIWLLKFIGFAIYLLQLVVTYVVRRLDYEMRWYMVTDRSLRLRHGVWKVTESTMSFANVQHVVVTQGPLQRLLHLADVKVQSAGGGGTEKHQAHGEDMHVGLFHSVTNAPEIRDLILERLRRFRESGLGDPDEPSSVPAVTSEPCSTDTLAAARQVLSEARALRVTLT